MGNVEAKSLKKYMKLSCVRDGEATITLCKSNQIIGCPGTYPKEDLDCGLKGSKIRRLLFSPSIEVAE